MLDHTQNPEPSQLSFLSPVKVHLSGNYESIVSYEDRDLANLCWEPHVGPTGRVYAKRRIKVNGKRITIRLHRLVAERIIGRCLSPDEKPDHINNNPLDNRRENLRVATHSQNIHNRDITPNRGAYYHKRDKKWSSSIGVNGKRIHLGTFDTREEAHVAYKNASIKYYGDNSPYYLYE